MNLNPDYTLNKKQQILDDTSNAQSKYITTTILFLLLYLFFFIYILLWYFQIKFIDSIEIDFSLQFSHIKSDTFLSFNCNKYGFPKNGVKAYLNFYNKEIPSIYDVFYDDGHIIVIMSLHSKHLDCPTPNDKYNKIDWFCKPKGSQNIIKNIYHFSDKHHRVKVLKFPVSQETIEQSSGLLDIFSLDFNIKFSDVPFCILPLPPSEDKIPFATLCTQQLYTPSYEILDWLIWHISQGFNHAFIYYNDINIDEMKNNLSTAIESGFLTLIDWNWPKTVSLQDQVPSTMSCLYRNKRRFNWIGYNDIDEAFFPKTGTVFDALNEIQPIRNDISSLAAPNRYYLKSSRLLSSSMLCSEDIERFPIRQKVIVNPENAEYFSIHDVTLGKKEIRSDKLVNAHFKTREDLKKYKPNIRLINCSITRLTQKILQLSSQLNYSISRAEDY